MCDMNLFAERLEDLCGTSAESSRIIHPKQVHTAASMIIQCKSSLLTWLHKRRQMLNNAERQTGRASFLRTVWTSLCHYLLFSLTFFVHALPCKYERHFCVWNVNKCVVAPRTTTFIIKGVNSQIIQITVAFNTRALKVQRPDAQKYSAWILTVCQRVQPFSDI